MNGNFGQGTPITDDFLSADMAAQSLREFAVERIGKKDKTVSFGIKPLDSAGLPMFDGQFIVALGAKGNGKTTLLAHVVRTEKDKIRANPNMVRARSEVVVYVKLEETVERAYATIIAEPAAAMRVVAAGNANMVELDDAIVRWSGDPVIYVGNVAAKKGTFANRRMHGGITIPKLVGVLETVDRSYDIRLVVVDYLQKMAGTNPRAPDVERCAEIADGLLTIAGNLSCPMLCGAQANLFDIKRRPPANRMPELSDVWYAPRAAHDADAVIAMTYPASDGLSEITLPVVVNGAMTKRVLTVTPDMFLAKVLAWRDCSATGFIVPMGAGGGQTGRAFGRLFPI